MRGPTHLQQLGARVEPVLDGVGGERRGCATFGLVDVRDLPGGAKQEREW
jgi:hypothetical protein